MARNDLEAAWNAGKQAGDLLADMTHIDTDYARQDYLSLRLLHYFWVRYPDQAKVFYEGTGAPASIRAEDDAR